MNVNKDVFEDKWEQIRPQTQVWWSLFTEDILRRWKRHRSSLTNTP